MLRVKESTDSAFSFCKVSVVAMGSLLATLFSPLGVCAASVSVDRQGSEIQLSAKVQDDFAGTEAQVAVTENNTVEIRIPGADFGFKGAEGKKQLFRFEDAALKAASVSQDGSAGVLRFSLATKAADGVSVSSAAKVASQLAITRFTKNSKTGASILVAIPESDSAAATPLEGIKVISITASAEVSPNISASEDTAAEAPTLSAGETAKPASAVITSSSPTLGSSEATTAIKDSRSEAQIPVLVDKKEDRKSASVGIERLVITLAVVCVLLGAAVFGLKQWAARKGKASSTTKIQVLTQHFLGPKKSIAIIQVAGEAILIGITDQNISMLKTLALIDDEVPGVVPKNFADELDSQDFDERDAERDAEGDADERETDNFAMKGLSEVRDMVSTRLKGMRNLQ